MDQGADKLLQDGDGEGGVDEHQSEHAIGWGRQARKAHRRRTREFDGRDSHPESFWITVIEITGSPIWRQGSKRALGTIPKKFPISEGKKP